MLAAGILKDIEQPQYRLSRSQSLGDLSNSDFWRMNSYTTMDYVPVNATQSLDRRMLRYNTRLRRAGSMDELNNLRYCHSGSGSLWCEGRVYNVFQPRDFCLYGQPKFVNKSRTSLSESDDLQKYRDVALWLTNSGCISMWCYLTKTATRSSSIVALWLFIGVVQLGARYSNPSSNVMLLGNFYDFFLNLDILLIYKLT